LDEVATAWAEAAQSYARIEGAGVFWLAAELGILVLVRAGRRHLETVPLPATFRLTQRDAPILVFALASTLLLAGLFLSRHVFVEAPTDLPIAELASAAAQAERAHLAVWSAFVVGWVVLEALIVYHGWRGYRRLVALVRAAGET
jgi:hypothetical protein